LLLYNVFFVQTLGLLLKLMIKVDIFSSYCVFFFNMTMKQELLVMTQLFENWITNQNLTKKGSLMFIIDVVL